MGRSSLKTGPARPGHVKIALDITAVEIDLFFSLQYRYNDHIKTRKSQRVKAS